MCCITLFLFSVVAVIVASGRTGCVSLLTVSAVGLSDDLVGLSDDLPSDATSSSKFQSILTTPEREASPKLYLQVKHSGCFVIVVVVFCCCCCCSVWLYNLV